MRQLATLCRLASDEVEGLHKPLPVGVRGLIYCYRCLVLNPQDVFSPYWKDCWVGSSSSPCPTLRRWVGYVSPKDMRERRSLSKLLRMLERRWRRIACEQRNPR